MMDTGACLWMMTDNKIFGIRIEKLEKLGKNEVRDWKSHLEPAPFDFHLELPEVNMSPFIFASKLFLTTEPNDSGTKIYQISYVGGDTVEISEAVATGAIPPLPTGFPNYIANIKGDVYFVGQLDAQGLCGTGLWVLRSNSREWVSVSAPPTEYDSDNLGCPFGFVLKDKLFLCPLPARGISYVYDPPANKWTRLESTFSPSDHHSLPSFVLVSPPGDVGDRSVVLTGRMKSLPGRSRVKYDIHALLVDNQDYRVHRRQRLDEVWEAIQPSFFKASDSDLSLVDLGNSKVCVMIGGLAERIPSLCILVVELGLVQEEEQQRFLSVRVLVNRVFDMVPDNLEDRSLEVPCTSFIFSLSKGMPGKHPYSQDCISPRKVPKLAGGTNPSNPTTSFEQE
ncbi:uncharacterized protein LOC130980215 [Arachis stenosperma]|uniref:uncharacterized protein LOC130980215 n=1 Tax=Arachis stenosperma TaxID=217475 RepID=UPI0025AC99EB|nr:uncharacterized protein LOC130980215 [Arachis stenosperma]